MAGMNFPLHSLRCCDCNPMTTNHIAQLTQKCVEHLNKYIVEFVIPMRSHKTNNSRCTWGIYYKPNVGNLAGPGLFKEALEEIVQVLPMASKVVGQGRYGNNYGIFIILGHTLCRCVKDFNNPMTLVHDFLCQRADKLEPIVDTYIHNEMMDINTFIQSMDSCLCEVLSRDVGLLFIPFNYISSSQIMFDWTLSEIPSVAFWLNGGDTNTSISVKRVAECIKQKFNSLYFAIAIIFSTHPGLTISEEESQKILGLRLKIDVHTMNSSADAKKKKTKNEYITRNELRSYDVKECIKLVTIGVETQSFVFAWVLDETGEERERGITMDVGSTRFETPNKIVTLLDAPGHKDFIPNMISGATQADVALLVVDGTRGEFETGFEQGGQTREHALLVRSLGVSQLGVVVNKLDTVNWSKERFDEIVSKPKVFLRQAGFNESDVTYIPYIPGSNLVKPPTDVELTSWYDGPTLIQVIDNFKMPERSVDKPFRMSISDIFKGTGSGFCVSGRIETGVLCTNDKILVCPLMEQAVAKTIAMDDMTRSSVFAGDHVSVTLSGVEVSNISIGFILCDINNPIPITQRIQVRIIVFNIKVPITIGTPVLLHHQSLIEPAAIIKIKAQSNKVNGEVVKKNPRCLGNNTCALVEIETTKQICIEKYADCKELGRVMLRVGGVTVAAGLVTKILK